MHNSPFSRRLFIHQMALAPVLLAGCRAKTASPSVTIFAAAAMNQAVTSLAAGFEAQRGTRVRCSFDASSTLAQQIVRGAPADLFLSAHPRWMDHVLASGLAEPSTRVDLVGNRLVVVAPVSTSWRLGNAVHQLPESFTGRIALGDPAHVPVGQYAKQAFERLGIWNVLAPRVLPMKDVRASLAAVESGSVECGVVYETDAKASTKVRVIAAIPSDLHEPIRYSLVCMKTASSSARAFWNHLQSSTASVLYTASGFSIHFVPKEP